MPAGDILNFHVIGPEAHQRAFMQRVETAIALEQKRGRVEIQYQATDGPAGISHHALVIVRQA